MHKPMLILANDRTVVGMQVDCTESAPNIAALHARSFAPEGAQDDSIKMAAVAASQLDRRQKGRTREESGRGKVQAAIRTKASKQTESAGAGAPRSGSRTAKLPARWSCCSPAGPTWTAGSWCGWVS